MFIDQAEIEVIAGNGGHGAVAFRTEKFIPKGGPEGGDGGRGGDVLAIADSQLTTLLDFRYKRKYKAPNGQPGGGSMKTGKSGGDITIRLPVGTLITNLETGLLIADLDKPGVKITVCRGGKGGHGNTYYKSSTNQTPRKAQDGWPGEKKRMSLELKLLADVGLVGLPNAGKSTILAAFSQARPKIADYPFTTLQPNLGIVRLREFKTFVMADIPGLIEGASSGKGLGHRFLKHIQRTALLLLVIDINDDIQETRDLLISELEKYDQGFLRRPSLTIVTKTDTKSESDLEDISKDLPDDYILLSAVSGNGRKTFLQEIERRIDKQRT